MRLATGFQWSVRVSRCFLIRLLVSSRISSAGLWPLLSAGAAVPATATIVKIPMPCLSGLSRDCGTQENALSGVYPLNGFVRVSAISNLVANRVLTRHRAIPISVRDFPIFLSPPDDESRVAAGLLQSSIEDLPAMAPSARLASRPQSERRESEHFDCSEEVRRSRRLREALGWGSRADIRHPHGDLPTRGVADPTASPLQGHCTFSLEARGVFTSPLLPRGLRIHMAESLWRVVSMWK